MVKNCQYCGKEFAPKRKGPQGQRQKCCSRECMGLLSRKPKKECSICHKMFSPSRPERKYCSKECADNYQRRNIIYAKCQICSKSFQVKKKQKKFCSKECRGVFFSENPVMLGKSQSDAAKEKIGTSNRKHEIRYCSVCGKKITGQDKKYCGRDCLNKDWSINNPIIGKTWKQTDEVVKRKRFLMIDRLKKIDKNFHPPYNEKACEWFKKFDQLNESNGQYATNGGEYFIKDLGYWVDYINFERKLIVEWDEEGHYKHDQLKEKDLRRQKEITEYFKDFEFKRIREKDLMEIS